MAILTTFNVVDILSQGKSPSQWLEHLCATQHQAEKNRLRQAFEAAKNLYGNLVLTDINVPVFNRAVATAALVNSLGLLNDAVIASLFFYVPAIKKDSSAWVTADFGEECKSLVEGVYQLQKLTAVININSPKVKRLATNQAEIFRKMLLAMVHDIRVVLIQLAWRTVTLCDLSSCQDKTLQYRIAQETLWIFSPLANRLGVWQIKWLLEDYALRYTEPEAYQKIVDLLHAHRDERGRYIGTMTHLLKQNLLKANIKAEVSGRPKHIFSIWQKMHNKQIDFDDLYDLFAVRVLVDTTKDCYRALSLVQELWRPIEKEFNDYIAKPKSNHYQSLHTAVTGPDNKSVEIQIRTFAMHAHAELGVASHWRYKEGGSQESVYEKKISWLRQLLGWQEELFGKAHARLSSDFKTDLFSDHIYTVTPTGHVVALRKSSTPIDFAYALHTDLGHRCRGAKIDGRIASLSTPLQNGQCVEILTHKTGGPSINWLYEGWVKSARAITKIRQYIRQQNIENARLHGKQMLEKLLAHHTGETINRQTLAEKLGFAKIDNLHIALGEDKLAIETIVRYLNEMVHGAVNSEVPVFKTHEVSQNAQGILIEGIDNLSTTLAKCCRPAPPDNIVSFITQRRGASIHRQNCATLKRLFAHHPERFLNATWPKLRMNDVFPVNFGIIAIDRVDLLQDISHAFALSKLNVTAFNATPKNNGTKFIFTVEVRHVADLQYTLNALQRVDGVISAKRV